MSERTPGGCDAESVRELTHRLQQVEDLTRQHADQLGVIWKDLTHHLNSIQGLLTREQDHLARTAAMEAASEQLAARVQAIEATGGTHHPTPAASSVSPYTWIDADRRRLEDQGLFVVGTARSGTTILYETLNDSPDVYLLGEAMLFEEAFRPDFAEFHDRRHVGYGHAKHKGGYLPRGLAATENGFDLLRRLAERYRYVGEKVALGPWHVTDRGPDVFDSFLHFHATHFFHSRYALIVRRPVVSVASMNRLWSQFTIPQLLTTWAVGFRVGVELASTFPHVFVLPHESLSEEVVARLGEKLGLEFDVPAGRYDREFQKTAGAAERLPPQLDPYRNHLDSLTALCDEWTAAFSPTTFRYSQRESSRPFFDRLCGRAAELIGRFAEDAERERTAG